MQPDRDATILMCITHKVRCREGLRILVLLHALIPCLTVYHPLSCCIYTALVSLLFGAIIPASFNILMEMFLLICFTVFSLYTVLYEPHFAARVKCTWVIMRKWCSTTWK